MKLAHIAVALSAATGALSGESLRIRNDTVMASADFLDRAYVRGGVTP